MRKLRVIHATLAKSHIRSHKEARVGPWTLGPWASLALELLTSHIKEHSPKGMEQKPECVSERVEG